MPGSLMKVRKFTKQELAHYNGRENRPAFIAYQGKVYDVSHSFLWQKGRHQVVHVAGNDLTNDLAQAPHSEDLLARCPVVGMLVEE
jgi:predicted heme/steroid binding protein